MSATHPNSFSNPRQSPPSSHPRVPFPHRSEGNMQLPPMSSLLRHEPHPGFEERASHYPPSQSQFTGYTHPLQLSEMNPSAPPQHIYHPAQPSQYSAKHTRQIEPQLVPIPPQQMLKDPVQYSGPPAPRRQSKKISQRRADFPKDHVQVNRSSASLEGRYNEPANGLRSPDQEPYSPHRKPSSTSTKDELYPQESQTKSLPISGLLSPTSSLERPRPTYNLIIRQQPHSARACGYGERDRRVVDPPPILILDIDNPADGAMMYVVHCVLWNADSDTDATTMPESTERKQQRRLMGSNITNAFPGKDENNDDKLFFPFADISVRTPGTYRLKFNLCELDMANMGPGSKSRIVATAMSNPFQVFNAKDFGGMQASSALTKSLKAQGCLIPVKKGNSKTNASHMSDDEEDGYNDDMDDDERPSGGAKRPKHR